MRRLRAIGSRTGAGQGSGPRGGGRRGAGAGTPGGGTDVLALELTFLSPLGALVVPGRAAPRSPRSSSHAGGPAARPPRSGSPSAHAAAAACCSSPRPAAPSGSRPRSPCCSRSEGREARTDVEALFVLDVSRSMLAAAGPDDATRLERAREAALELRATIPQVRAGVAGLTDRALPYLFPTLDQRDVRVDAAGLRHDRVAAAAAGRPGRHQLRRARRARHERVLHAGPRPAGVRGPDRRGERAVHGAGRGLPARRRPVLERGRAGLSRRRARAAVPAGRRGTRLAAKLGPVAQEGDLGRARELLAAAVGEGPASAAGSEPTTVALAPYVAFVGFVLVLALVVGRPRSPVQRATMVEA